MIQSPNCQYGDTVGIPDGGSDFITVDSIGQSLSIFTDDFGNAGNKEVTVCTASEGPLDSAY